MFQAFAELNQITDQTVLDTKVRDYNKEVDELWDKLMGLELQLVDQLEVIINLAPAEMILCMCPKYWNTLTLSILGKIFSRRN